MKDTSTLLARCERVQHLELVIQPVGRTSPSAFGCSGESRHNTTPTAQCAQVSEAFLAAPTIEPRASTCSSISHRSLFFRRHLTNLRSARSWADRSLLERRRPLQHKGNTYTKKFQILRPAALALVDSNRLLKCKCDLAKKSKLTLLGVKGLLAQPLHVSNLKTHWTT